MHRGVKEQLQQLEHRLTEISGRIMIEPDTNKRNQLDSIVSESLILCVDDETTGLAMRKMTLESQGYRVVTAENADEGLAIFASQGIDLVILDYMMPGMNGDVVAEKMKGLKPAVPIILLSAYVDLPRETLAPVDMYLTKGEGPQVMLKAIAELLTSQRRPR